MDPLRTREAADAALVLGRENGPAVGVTEAGSGRIAVDRNDVEAALLRGCQRAELRCSRA